MDTDEPADPTELTAPVEDEHSEPSAEGPASDDEGGEAGPSPIEVDPDEPAATDMDDDSDSLVGDFTVSEVDLSGLQPTTDGDPDDDEDSAPTEEAPREDVPAGQPGDHDGHSEGQDAP